jgi:hypothetical protein
LRLTLKATPERSATPTIFYKSRLAWNGSNGWTITLKDGTQLHFPDSENGTRPQWAAMTELRDRFGNRVLVGIPQPGT